MNRSSAVACEEGPTGLINIVDHFVRAADRRRLLNDAERGQWVRSVVEAPHSLPLDNSGRSSESLFLPFYSTRALMCLRRIEGHLETILQIDPSRLEPWQMVRYRRGGFYDYHIDCGSWSEHPSGERARTILIVLEEPARGGATHFRALARSIRPLAGRLIVWRNLLPTGHRNHAMIHSGRPVWQGRKIILTTWERQRTYNDG